MSYSTNHLRCGRSSRGPSGIPLAQGRCLREILTEETPCGLGELLAFLCGCGMDVFCSLLLGLIDLQVNADEQSPHLEPSSLGRDPGLETFLANHSASLNLFSQSTGVTTTFQSLGRTEDDIWKVPNQWLHL